MPAAEPALSVRRNFPRPDAADVQALTGIAVGWVVDAMGRQGALAHRIRPLTRASAFTGVAITVKTRPRDNLAPWLAIEHARRGDVLVIETGDYEGASVVGDVLLGIARNAGIVACVTDGMVRDIDGIDELGIPVFARGISPNSPLKDGPGEIGTAVVVGGMSVRSGDIVVGDKNGVAIVPREKAAEVVAALAGIAAREKQMDAAVQGGATQAAWVQAAIAAKGVRFLD